MDIKTDAKWQIAEVSNFTKVFETLTALDPPPVIILFGVESDLKNQLEKAVIEAFRGRDLAVATENPNATAVFMGVIGTPIATHRPVLFIQNSYHSTHPSHRIDTVNRLRGLGADNIIGLFAKSSFPTKDTDLLLTPDLVDFPPRPGDFDRLITVTHV